jgi:hypothetical protein
MSDEWDDRRDIDDVNDFLESGGIPGASFENIGDNWHGQIVRAKKVQSRDFETREAKTWDDGSPMHELQIDLQTDVRSPDISGDDGVRRLFCRGGMLQAVRQALRASKERLQPGGWLDVTYTGDGTATRRGLRPPKIYSAKYEPGQLAAGISADDLT